MVVGEHVERLKRVMFRLCAGETQPLFRVIVRLSAAAINKLGLNELLPSRRTMLISVLPDWTRLRGIHGISAGNESLQRSR